MGFERVQVRLGTLIVSTLYAISQFAIVASETTSWFSITTLVYKVLTESYTDLWQKGIELK